MAKTISLLNGEYAFFVFDINKVDKSLKLYLTRDHCGIRPLFYGETEHTFGFCSEIKGLTTQLGTPNAK